MKHSIIALGYYASVTMRDGTVRYFGDQVTTVAAVINVEPVVYDALPDRGFLKIRK